MAAVLATAKDPMPLPALASLLSLATFALTFQPARVPAKGSHTANLQIPTTGMVHVEVKNGHGVACTLIDRVNGPFATAGEPGKQDCATDQLLAAGNYRAELTGPAHARGEATLIARPFTELNQPAPRLADGGAHETKVHAGEQASYWIHVEHSSFVWLRARGRTAGVVALWRDGDWRENVPLRGGRRDDGAQGQPVYEWRIEQSLEAGDYLFTVYGAEPLPWTAGTPDDTVRVEEGFPLLPASGRLAGVLPAGGVLTFRAPLERAIAALELSQGIATATTLGVHGIATDGTVSFDEGGSCTLAARTQDPLCALNAQGGSGVAVEVRGAPGTAFTLEVGPLAPWDESVDARASNPRRAYGPPSSQLPLAVATSGRYDLELRDMPPDADAAPLSCALIENPNGMRRVVGRDDWRLPEVTRQPVVRPFNYDGHHETVAFALASGRDLVIGTGGERKTHCELFRVDGDRRSVVTVRRLTADDDENACRLQATLSAGAYELQLSGGNEGVETLIFAAAKAGGTNGLPDLDKTAHGAEPAKATCKLAGVNLQAGASYVLYTSRVGAAVARGLRVRPTGVADAKDELWKAAPGVAAYTPTKRPLPVLTLDQPAAFDFERRQSHALVFEAKEAGVYSLTTEGLLATACEIRTATAPSPASGEQAGRGRNCLAETYLEPGRYLATATTTGASRGRASVLLSKKVAKVAPRVTLKETAAFAAAAGELVRQPVLVRGKRSATFELGTEALGPSILCRLEDAQGWPLARPGAPCRLRATLKPGAYVWMQLPLTTDTRRQTALASTEPARVLGGKKTHVVALNQTYHVDLADSGHDTFVFRVPAALDARVYLDHEMQGRLLRQSDDGKAWTPVEVIAARAPERSGGGEGEAEGEEGEGQPAGDAAENAEDAGDEGAYRAGGDEGGDAESEGIPRPAEGEEAEGHGGDGEGASAEGGNGNGDGDGALATERPTRRRKKTQAELVADLPALHLAAGRYRLVTEHVRGDRHLRYQLALVTDDLLPGVSRDIDVPFKGHLRVPSAGLFTLHTEGATDVTCRLFREGRLVTESREDSANWNCNVHEPLPAGDYELAIEAASLQPGPSHIVLDMARTQAGPKLEPTADAAAGTRATFKVGRRPVMLALPASVAGTVVSLALKSDRALSWALLDAKDRVESRETPAAKELSFVLNPRGEGHRLLVWTAQPTAKVEARLAQSQVVDVAVDGSLPRERVGRIAIARDGRYGLPSTLLCAPEKTAGLLAPCGPDVSLEAGATLFAAREPGKTPKVALKESTKKLDGAETFVVKLGTKPFMQRQVSATQAVHLLRVRLHADIGAEPSCQFARGVRVLRGGECLALGSAEPDALASVALPVGEVDAEITRMAWPLAAKVQVMAPGEINLRAEKRGTRAALPQQPWRMSLLLPPGAWAGVLGPTGAARDLCPPEPALARCALSGAGGGELWLWSPDGQAVTGTLLAETSGSKTLATTPGAGEVGPGGAVILGTTRALLETWPHEPTVERVSIPAANTARVLRVAGPEGCVLHDADGSRLPGCNAALAAGHAYEMTLNEIANPVRAFIVPATWEATPEAYLFARPRPEEATAAIVPGQVVPLAGAVVARSLVLAKDAVVNVRATGGVCGLFDADTARVVRGAGAGCGVARWLPAGRYVIAVRGFADRPLDGALSLTTAPLESLPEGKAKAQAIGPGETRLFRFDMRADGGAGLGLDAPAETLTCELLDGQQRPLGVGCQQLLSLTKGTYFLQVSSPATAAPLRFRPVLLGLSGAAASVPSEYLEDLRQRLADEARSPATPGDEP